METISFNRLLLCVVLVFADCFQKEGEVWKVSVCQLGGGADFRIKTPPFLPPCLLEIEIAYLTP